MLVWTVMLPLSAISEFDYLESRNEMTKYFFTSNTSPFSVLN